MNSKLQKEDTDWKELLTPEQYHVTREKGTEQPFTGQYYQHQEQGNYVCVCCDEHLFSSGTKYDAGTGWPSFWQPLTAEKLETESDCSGGKIRTEVHCRNCGAHLGHVFEDGPQPSGLRYCINSTSLAFQSTPSVTEQGETIE